MSEAIASGDAAALHFPRAMLRVVVNVRDVRVLQYLLTLLCDYLLADLERRSALLLAEGELVLTALLQLVGTSGSGACITSTDANPYVLEYAARAASLLLSIDASFGVSVSSFKAWVQQNLRLYGSSSPKQVKVTEVREGCVGTPAALAPASCSHTTARTHTHAHTHTHTNLLRWPWSPS